MMYYGRKVLEKSIHLSGSLEYRFLDKINYAFEELYIEDEDWAMSHWSYMSNDIGSEKITL